MKLCYSIGEADRTFCGEISRLASAGANGRNISANDSFNIGWRHITKEELSANMDCGGKISPIGIFTVGFMGDYGRGNQFGKVVHDKSGKNLLVNVLHLFRVKMEQTNRVFKFPERGFNTPAHGIKLPEYMGRKIFGIQIGNNGFINAFRYFETNKAEGQVVEYSRVMLTISFGEIIKIGIGRDAAKFILSPRFGH